MITYRRAVSNVRKVMESATPEDRVNGIAWYREAGEEVDILSRNYGLPRRVVCHIVAALSPGIRWSQNLTAAESVLEGKPESLGAYPMNLMKASRIRDLYLSNNPDWQNTLSGPKVTAFAEALESRGGDRVTIDVHAYSLAAGVRHTTKNMPGIRVSEREAITRAYTTVAWENGISPAECQAICWVSWRRLNNL